MPMKNDPQLWTDDEVAAGLNDLAIPELTMYIGRTDRHDKESKLQTVRLRCGGALSYDSITQIAGLFETPHISFTPIFGRGTRDDCKSCESCLDPMIEIVVRWEAAPPVSKLPVVTNEERNS